MLKLRSRTAVIGYGRPLITPCFTIDASHSENWFNCECHAFNHFTRAVISVMEDYWLRMKYGPNTMPNKMVHHTIIIFFSMFTDYFSNFFELHTIFADSNSLFQTFFCHLYKLLH
uniref:Uncharacterized protein n=1 Tax=Opuntia streptacantha TaxID=393608 RepID=A0A7C9AK46_OPUST